MTEPEKGTITGVVQSVIFKGMHYEIIVESGDNEVVIQGTRGAKVGETIGMCLEPDGIHVILADTNQNIYEGELTKNYMVEFAGGEYDCDVTRLYPGSTINAEGVLVDASGDEIQTAGVKVKVKVPVESITMSDDTENGEGICGNIISLIYKGDHYHYIVRTKDEFDFHLHDEYLWNENDYVRLPERSTRQKLQKKVLGLPEFPTTTIGSFPQTKDVKANRQAYRKGEISEQEYIDFNRKKIAECVALQEEIGLDVLVHGEYERNDMVEYFGEALGGFLFTEKAWVQSYGTRCVKPPVIWRDVYRKNPITVAWAVYAQSLTKKPMKGMLTGPVTILNWSFPREDISIRESIAQIALAIRDEVLDLEANGIQVIQIDEAALREKLPLRKSDWYTEYLDFAISAFRLTHSGVKPETQIHTHMCYSEFTDIIAAIDDMDADVITFEASRSDLQILDSLRENHFETEVGPGVYDIHSPRVPSVEEIVNALHIMLTKIEKDKLWVNPDCGLKTRGTKETEASLRNMVEAAKEIRKQA